MNGVIRSLDARTLGGKTPEEYAERGGFILARLGSQTALENGQKLNLVESACSSPDIFEMADGGVKVKRAGCVMCATSMMVSDGGSGKYVGLQIRKNGEFLYDSYGNTGSLNYGVVNVLVRPIHVDAGDIITMVGAGTSAVPIAASDRTSLTIWMIA